jgi:hypothetical protein
MENQLEAKGNPSSPATTLYVIGISISSGKCGRGGLDELPLRELRVQLLVDRFSIAHGECDRRKEGGSPASLTEGLFQLVMTSYVHRFNRGRAVPQTAIPATVKSQKGITATPGIDSRISPGSSSHCQPKTINNRIAVTRSTPHTIGGAGIANAPRASEIAAIAKARARRFFEN